MNASSSAWDPVARLREELAGALAAEGAAERRSLAVELLARSLVEAYSGAVSEGRPRESDRWLAGNLLPESPSRAVRRFLDAASDVLRTYLGECTLPETHLGVLQELDESLRRALDRRSESVSVCGARLDAVDAAAHALLKRSIGADRRAMPHAENVARWSGRLAQRLALREAQVTFARRCGLLHDVGAGDDATEQHPVLGERLVCEEPLLAAFGSTIRMHHEHLDGSGYPDGLRGDAIPLVARIVAVASRFNDLITGEHERPAVTIRQALQELAAASGTLYDVRVVAALHDGVDRPG